MNDGRFQLGLVDHIAGQQEAETKYGASYTAWRAQHQELRTLQAEEARAQGEVDFARFQLDELEQARLLPDEQGSMEQELARAENAEELIQALNTVEEAVTDENVLRPILARVKQVLAKPARLDDTVGALLDRLNSVHIELKDIADEAARSVNGIAVDPTKAAQLRERLDMILRLQQKHRVGSNAELLAIQHALAEKVERVGSLADRIAALAKQVDTHGQEVLRMAKALSTGRTGAVKPLATKVESILQDLGMPHAVFQYEHRIAEATMEHCGPHGLDTVRAVYS